MPSVRPGRANDIVQQHLGLPVLTTHTLLERAEATLGEALAGQAWKYVMAARLTRRHFELGALAGLTVGTDLVGEAWWDEPVRSAYPRDWHPLHDLLDQAGLAPDTQLTPREVLEGRLGHEQLWGTSPLGRLSGLLADHVAGPAVAWVDLNWPGPEHLIEFPAGVGPGQDVVLAFNPGGRLRGRTLIDSGGRQAVRVDLNSASHSIPGTVDWAVGVTWQGVVVHLPDEEPGTAHDPWIVPLTAEARTVADALRAWAVSVGAPLALFEPAWSTKADVARAWTEAMAAYGRDAIAWPGVSGGSRFKVQTITASLLDETDLSQYEQQLLGVEDGTTDDS